jgi:hypothetical protein
LSISFKIEGVRSLEGKAVQTRRTTPSKGGWYRSLMLHVSGVPRKGTPTSEMTRPKKKKAMILVSTNYCMGNYCMRKAKITIIAL